MICYECSQANCTVKKAVTLSADNQILEQFSGVVTTTPVHLKCAPEMFQQDTYPTLNTTPMCHLRCTYQQGLQFLGLREVNKRMVAHKETMAMLPVPA